jgi:hypothetical protein
MNIILLLILFVLLLYILYYCYKKYFMNLKKPITGSARKNKNKRYVKEEVSEPDEEYDDEDTIHSQSMMSSIMSQTDNDLDSVDSGQQSDGSAGTAGTAGSGYSNISGFTELS